MTPQEEKQYKYLGIAAIVIIGGYYLFYNPNDPTGSATDPTIDNGAVFNAFNTATAIYEAMKDSGTDEDTVISLLKTVSKTQFAEVFKAFGKLPYNTTTGNQYFAMWETPTKYDLKKWLFEELSTTEYNNLRRKYPNYL